MSLKHVPASLPHLEQQSRAFRCWHCPKDRDDKALLLRDMYFCAQMKMRGVTQGGGMCACGWVGGSPVFSNPAFSCEHSESGLAFVEEDGGIGKYAGDSRTLQVPVSNSRGEMKKEARRKSNSVRKRTAKSTATLATTWLARGRGSKQCCRLP